VTEIAVAHLVYVAAMVVGAAIIVWWSREPRGIPRYEYLAHAAIPIWSGIAYLTVVFGLGRLVVDDRAVYIARYADWVVTTPLLLLVLGWMAMQYSEHKRVALLATLVIADVVMVLTGLIADLATDPVATATFYAIGVAALVLILYLIWVPLRRIAEASGPALGKRYVQLTALLTFTWVGYPTVWLLGPSGLGVLGERADMWLFVALPIVSKVVFSVAVLAALRGLAAERDEAGVIDLTTPTLEHLDTPRR
jgi:bacteriorhodopsin